MDEDCGLDVCMALVIGVAAHEVETGSLKTLLLHAESLRYLIVTICEAMVLCDRSVKYRTTWGA